MKKNSCFYDSIRPTMYLSCITGVMPAFPLKLKQSHQTVHTGGILNMIILIYLTVYLFSVADLACSEWEDVVKETIYGKDIVSKSGLQLFLLLSMSCLIVVYIGGLLLTTKLKNLYTTLFKLDHDFRSIKLIFPYRKYFFLQIIIYVVIYSTSVLINVMNNRFGAAEGQKSIKSLHWFALCAPHALELSLVSQFNSLLFFVYSMFRSINERLEGMKTRMEDGKTNFQINEITNQITKLMKLHYKLCDLVDLFTSIYGPAMLISYVVQFFSTIMFIIGFIVYVPQRRPLTTFCFIFWSFQRIFELTTVCLIAELVKRTASSTKQWVNKLLIESSNSELVDKLNEFSLQLQYERAAIIVVDMLELNANLILKLWSSIFGYIIIFYQFRKHELE